jgi:LemA protein
MEIIYIILAIVAVVILYVIALYNGLIKLKNRVKEAWSDIDVQLKRRYNLIPNLVETVKGYATHEKELFENVTKARTAAMGATGVKDKAETENMLTGALKSLFAVSENYPDLKASENFVELQRELRDTEDKIQAARRFYNTNARDMNIKIESFPANLIAKPLGFKMADFFEIEEPEQRENVKVKF